MSIKSEVISEEDESLEELENRIREIELQFFSNSSIIESTTCEKTPFDQGCPQDEQILHRIHLVRSKLSLLENSYVRDMFQKYDAVLVGELESVVDENRVDHLSDQSRTDKNIEIDILLPIAEKIDLILHEKDMVDQMSSQLKNLASLLPFVEADPRVSQAGATRLSVLNSQLEQIEISTVSQSLNVHTLLNQYNEITSLLSQKFLNWNQTMKGMEKEVERLLTEQMLDK